MTERFRIVPCADAWFKVVLKNEALFQGLKSVRHIHDQAICGWENAKRAAKDRSEQWQILFTIIPVYDGH